MTISQLRRRIDAVKRKLARELAIIKLRRIAEAVADGLGTTTTSRYSAGTFPARPDSDGHFPQ